MSALWTFLLAAAGPLVIRALTALGFAAVTVTGVTAAVNALISSAQGSYAGLPAAVLQLASLAGVPVAIGLVFGAFVARMTLWVGTNTVKLLFKGT